MRNGTCEGCLSRGNFSREGCFFQAAFLSKDILLSRMRRSRCYSPRMIRYGWPFRSSAILVLPRGCNDRSYPPIIRTVLWVFIRALLCFFMSAAYQSPTRNPDVSDSTRIVNCHASNGLSISPSVRGIVTGITPHINIRLIIAFFFPCRSGGSL